MKVITKKISLCLVLLGVFYTNFACGQTYKCRNADGRFTYSDSPCTVGAKTEKTISFVAPTTVTISSQDGSDSTLDSSSTHQRNLRYLNMKIDEAISAGDLRQAKQLALTPEHWKKINDAEEISAHPIEKPSVAQHPQQQTQSQQQTPQFQPIAQQPQITQTRNQQNVEQAQQQQQAVMQAQQQQQQAVMQAQQRQQQAVIQAQQQQQNEMQAYRQQQLQESQRLGQELNVYMQSPSVTKAIEGAGSSGASMQNLLINNKINQLNQTAGNGVTMQPPAQRK